MTRPDYYEYIRSSEWREKADEAKRRAGYRCQVCNRPASEVTLDTHHRTYERLGDERPNDLTVLCRDCHKLYETQNHLPNPPAQTTIDPTYSVEPENDATSESPTLIAPEKHMLTWMGKLVWMAGGVAAVVLFFLIDLRFLWEDVRSLDIFFGLFRNPYQDSFGQILTLNIFWQFVAAVVVGWGLAAVGQGLVAKLMPKTGAMKWYWKWGGAALIRVPIFFFVWYLVYGNIVKLGVITYSEAANLKVDFSGYLVTLSILAVYVALLPLPVLHLTWDNRYEGNWRKLGTSIVLLVVLLGTNFLVGWMANSELCTNGMLMNDVHCRLYGIPPGKRLSSLVRTMRSSEDVRQAYEETVDNDLSDGAVRAAPPDPALVSKTVRIPWKTVSFNAGKSQTDVPFAWKKIEEEDGRVQFGERTRGIDIMWEQQETGPDIVDIIEDFKGDSEALAERDAFLQESIEDRTRQGGAELVEFNGTRLVDDDEMHAVYYDVVLAAPDNQMRPTRSLVLEFDCSREYWCQLVYYREGIDEVSREEWGIISGVIDSLDMHIAD